MRINGRPPSVVCHHCGRDYAAAYWEAESYFVWHGLEPRPDPICCFSCRRDTNPDAADAPRWTSSHTADDTPRAQIVTTARKQCRTCGAEWDGLIFGSAASKGSPLPFGICPVCLAKDEARTALLSAPRITLPAPVMLTRPRRTADYDDARYGA